MPSLFENATNSVLYGDVWAVGGSVYYGSPPVDHQQEIKKIVEKDSPLNEYSRVDNTFNAPRFSKELLLNLGPTDSNRDAGQLSSGSCCFDLASCLGLLPGQANESRAEYDKDIPINKAISRGDCCCGRISRHGFIFLVSQYFQEASTVEATGGGTCMVLTTSIGRFKCYEIQDRTFVHFDSTTRKSNTNLIKGQNLDHVLRSSQGQYLINSDGKDIKKFIWNPVPAEKIDRLSVLHFFRLPDGIIYMTAETRAQWKRVKQFSLAMIETVFSMCHALTEPVSFVKAWKNAFEIIERVNRERNSDPRTVEAAEWVAYALGMTRLISKSGIETVSEDSVAGIAGLGSTLAQAHQDYRSPRAVDAKELLNKSIDRFVRLLGEFQLRDDGAEGQVDAHIQADLRKTLESNSNNITLVVYQAWLAQFPLWNSTRILSRARAVPAEWLRFIAADDDYILLG